MHRDPIASSMAASLKIGIVSHHPAMLEHLHELLLGWNSLARVVGGPGGLEHAARLAEQEQPQVLLVEGLHHDQNELAALERLTARHPAMAVILLSPNHAPEFLRHAMRIGLRDVLPVPLAREALLEAVTRAQQRLMSASAPRRKGKILTFVGCKGGSGATFLATNLAYAIAEESERKVALLDLNCQFGDAALYVTHRAPACTLADVAQQTHRLDASLLASSMIQVRPNFHLLPAPEEPEQALQVSSESIDALLAVAAGHYDVVVIDAGRSLDELTLRAMDRSEQLFAVLQLNLPFLRDAKRLLRVLAALGYGKDKVKLLVNRFQKSGAVSLEDAVATLRQEAFRVIPNSFRAVADSVNQGVPIVQLAPRDPVAKCLRELAVELAGVKKPNGSWLRSVLPGL
jgi:pilus assembly protein CpaE